MKSFLSFLNDEKAVKKVLFFVTPFLLILLVFAGIKLGSYIKNYEPAPEPESVQDEITEPTTDGKQTAEDNTLTVTLPTEYKPFECSKNDFTSFICATSYDDGSWFGVDIFTDELYYKTGDEEKVLFRFPTSVRPSAYIGNALYLSDYSAQALYRIVIDADGNYDLDSFSLVTDFFAWPAFVDENKLLLYAEKQINPKYVMLNTLTGEYEETEDCDKELTEVPSGLISAKQAEEIALKEVQKSKYQDKIGGYTFSIATDSDTKSSLTKLVYRPDLSHPLGGGYQYESIPDYCWCVYTVADDDVFGFPQFNVFINAETGNIAKVSIHLPD